MRHRLDPIMRKPREMHRDDDEPAAWSLALREGLVMALWFGSLLGLMVLGYGAIG